MPKQRSNHVQKNRPEQRAYRKGIKNASASPTVDSEPLFSQTDHPASDNDFPNTGKRPSAWQQQFANHFKDNWIPWVCGFVLVLLGYFTVEAKIHFAGLDTTIDNHEQTLATQEKLIDSQRELNVTQNLAINETRTILGTIQTALAEIKADIREMRKPNGNQ